MLSRAAASMYSVRKARKLLPHPSFLFSLRHEVISSHTRFCGSLTFQTSNKKYLCGSVGHFLFSTTTLRPADNEANNGGGESNDDRERKLSFLKTMVGFSLVPIFLFIFYASSSNHYDDADNNNSTSQSRFVTWNEFYNQMLLAGEVEEVIVHSGVDWATVILYPDAVIKGQRLTGSNVFRLNIPRSMNIEDRIREIESSLGIKPGQGMLVTYERKSEKMALVLVIILVTFFVGLMVLGTKKFVRKMGSSFNPFSRLTKADFTLVDPQIRSGKGVRFADVAGLREAKIEILEFVDYLKNPLKYKELGAKPPKGAILFGPPGCGKTMLAKAVANESNVPFLSMNGSEFIEMIGGLGAARVRNLFAEARKRSPSIIYIDEIDAIGRQRGGGSGMTGKGEAEQTLNQLLVEMDGITSRQGVIMLASTNRPDVLDRALLRPGRFDRHITIDMPTLIERSEILVQHMKNVVLDQDESSYSERLATLTPGFSGADLANLINEAALHAARHKKPKVDSSSLEYAIERVVAGPEKKSSALSPAERRIVAYHESGHAIVGWMLEYTDVLLKVSILPRTSMVLGFAQYSPTEKKLYSENELFDRMCMALGGRVAESLTFNRVTTGAQNDLQKVTKIAYSTVNQFGFNQNIGLLSFEPSEGQKVFSKKLHATMDLEVRNLVAEAYKRTESVLVKHRDKLEQMASELLNKETLNYEQVFNILGPLPFKSKHKITPEQFEQALNEQSDLGSARH